MFFATSTETFMPVDIRKCHHWNKASYLYSITGATKIYSPFKFARKRKLMIKCFTLDDEVGVPIKPVKATQKSITYRFKAILLLWVSAFFGMLYFPFFVSV